MHPSLTAQQQSELEMRLQRWGLVIALAVTCLLFAVPAFSAAPDYADYKQAHQSFGSFLKAVQDLLAAVLALSSIRWL